MERYEDRNKMGETRDRNARDEGSIWIKTQRENNIVSREHKTERQVDGGQERATWEGATCRWKDRGKGACD